MSNSHYSDDDLVARLYGLGPTDAHLDNCEMCRQRWNMVQERHQLLHSTDSDVPMELLAAQRRAVYARVGQKPRRLRAAWLPLPVAALVLVLLTFTFFKPAVHQPALDVISDDAALQDVFTAASRIDPAGIQPVQSLFEEQK
jgi:predicted anti-sigma-YlaC factor YlaD